MIRRQFLHLSSVYQGLMMVHQWVVSVDGFVSQTVEAETASKARYKVYKLAREADYFRNGFREFIERVRSTWRKS